MRYGILNEDYTVYLEVFTKSVIGIPYEKKGSQLFTGITCWLQHSGNLAQFDSMMKAPRFSLLHGIRLQLQTFVA